MKNETPAGLAPAGVSDRSLIVPAMARWPGVRPRPLRWWRCSRSAVRRGTSGSHPSGKPGRLASLPPATMPAAVRAGSCPSHHRLLGRWRGDVRGLLEDRVVALEVGHAAVRRLL